MAYQTWKRRKALNDVPSRSSPRFYGTDYQEHKPRAHVGSCIGHHQHHFGGLVVQGGTGLEFQTRFYGTDVQDPADYQVHTETVLNELWVLALDFQGWFHGTDVEQDVKRAQRRPRHLITNPTPPLQFSRLPSSFGRPLLELYSPGLFKAFYGANIEQPVKRAHRGP
ncbi:hypothetical protein CC80DRAFT_542200 [Byssothecium circinans]|uniref:Uncharacterized protein n=1 Tax=Byssothecium circinans TaxID=147558 RepID=A0A6A5UFF7_9PLEO|nr:hypothetical protein CC80DRAFT_542200 [Byssothecium circinans]